MLFLINMTWYFVIVLRAKTVEYIGIILKMKSKHIRYDKNLGEEEVVLVENFQRKIESYQELSI